MSRFGLLCLTALLASPASSAQAAQPACPGQRVEDGQVARACAVAPAARLAAPVAADRASERGALVLDCSPLALAGLVSGAGTGGLHASQLVDATIRYCSRRGFVYGLAMQAPGRTAGGAQRRS